MTSTEQKLCDLELRLFQCTDFGYPVEITLDGQREFPRGYMPADSVPWDSGSDPPADGKKLLDALLHDNAVRDAWTVAREQPLPRRIRLRLDPAAPELHTLPWELLHEEAGMLSANANTPFSRYLPIALPWGSPVEARPIRILVTIANPDDLSQYNLAPLDVTQERQILQSIAAPHLQMDFLAPPITLERLEEALRKGYHIWHYLGHGAYNARRQQAALFLQDTQGHTLATSDDDLVGLLVRLESGVKPLLVFLAACQSATRATGDAFRGFGPRLVSVGVPAVVAMQDFVSVETARKFSTTFYTRLLEHGQVDQASNEARSTLMTAGRPDTAVPVLFMRLKSGQLWSAEADARGQLFGQDSSTFWTTLVQQIKKRRCTPIVGPRVYGALLPSPAEIAQQWARQHKYPFACGSDMARVAQYLATMRGESFPRYEWLDMLKSELVQRLPEALRPAGDFETLTALIEAVGWPALSATNPNEIHSVLAQLNLPLYLTTNPDSLLTEALKARGRTPRREVCRWTAELDEIESTLGADYVPTPEQPMVYHLFGSDEYADSLILSEDDYFKFLVHTSTSSKRISNAVDGVFSTTSLMFVGYSLYDWEFRTLMHRLVANRDIRRKFTHVAVQLEMADVALGANLAEVQNFLRKYFEQTAIDVYWGTTAQFIAELREQWEGQR